MAGACAAESAFALASAEEIIAEARAGRMFVLVDDENRENEGDLIIPAGMSSADTINFMAREGRGLICLAMDGAIADRLGLELMTQRNASRHGTAFTVSIEAREGVTTGISAADRARTIHVAVDPNARPDDLVSPGHVFPLRARDGGVLVRAGHTEAAVDIARLAGHQPAGVICEIMKDDGSMARLPDLVVFARRHGLKVGSIASLISYRLKHERFVDKIYEGALTSRYGGSFRLCIYANRVQYAEHIVLIKGRISGEDGPVPVRMHALDLVSDALGGGNRTLESAMRMIGIEGRGIIVLLREPNAKGLSQRLNSGADDSATLRDYGVGAQILVDLGVRRMELLTNNPKHIIGVEGYGLEVTGARPLEEIADDIVR
ncbi:MAG: 3,4-dihydroxy-2-butanone-4-phosphate synthase [Alphaproteobacteria bacterium]|nr:3,4-dihydroxy-2-butanone-4-phosphate synthase [Alphaproteobacteria bacterium]